MTPAIAESRLDELREISRTAPGLYPTAKRRYYHDVLQAIADGAEGSPRLARIALRAEDIGLAKAGGIGRPAAGSATGGGNAPHP